MTDPEPPPDAKPELLPPPPPAMPAPVQTKPSPPPPAPPAAAPAPPAPKVAPRAARSPALVLTAIGLLLVVGGLAYLWNEIATLKQPETIDPARLANVETQLRSLQQRLDVVERRPAAQPAAPSPAPAQVDLRPLETRIAALEQRPPSVAPAPVPPPPPAPDLGPLEARLATVETAARRALAMQGAAAALEAGRPLGAIPGAPASLARFATAAPPTIAGLRQEFPAAAALAEAASAPPDPPGLAAQAWQRVSGLVTVRRGSAVLVGSPAAYVLGEARSRLDNADLQGALAALDGLDAQAAAAMAPWRAKAQSLLDARAALAGG